MNHTYKDKQDLVKLIEKRMLDLNVKTITDLAELAEVNYNSLWSFLSKGKNIKVDYLLKIFKCLDIQLTTGRK